MKKFIFILPLFLLIGCATQATIKVPSVILLPEDKVFTVPQGQEINVLLDKKPLTMTFPQDMKLVSISYLGKQAEQLNDALLKKIKADKQKNQTFGIIGSIFAALAAGFGIWMKVIPWFKGFIVSPKK